ncbi:hypothetical protein BV22DRAFT_465355 [Leucogyrophana mollusca]|uniref:Uncharacterized protein n=1 Tax=Leucogyrophana mollusca TaxID=85980 RepID=A0ACB8BID8_9AGAM|nr:hypothetical protein BV22DRAFT_465355 [Leucogyrophana mollusca]
MRLRQHPKEVIYRGHMAACGGLRPRRQGILIRISGRLQGIISRKVGRNWNTMSGSSVAKQQLTLYRFKASPFAHKIELALTEAKAAYKVYDLDLANKPEWFTAKDNPASKVPAITYGGPDVPPEDPSPLSEKLAESAVVLEFVADIYPESGLLPKDPVLRAKV